MCSPLAMLCCYFIIQVKVITMLMVTLQTLRKTFKKLDNDIGVPEFLDARYIFLLINLRIFSFKFIPIEICQALC